MTSSINNTQYSDLDFLRLTLESIEMRLNLYNGEPDSFFYSEGMAGIIRVLNMLSSHIEEMQKRGRRCRNY